MLGLMFIEMDSFNELEQTSGYGVAVQKDFKEERLVWSVVEALEEFTAQVCEKKIESKRKKSLWDEWAMKNKEKKK